MSDNGCLDAANREGDGGNGVSQFQRQMWRWRWVLRPPTPVTTPPPPDKRFQYGQHERNPTRTLKGSVCNLRRERDIGANGEGGPKHQIQANCIHQRLTTLHPVTMCRQRSHFLFSIVFFFLQKPCHYCPLNAYIYIVRNNN